jgi:hypothetical protein
MTTEKFWAVNCFVNLFCGEIVVRAQKRVNYSAAATARREGHVEILPPVKQANRESFRRDTNVVAQQPEFSRQESI